MAAHSKALRAFDRARPVEPDDKPLAEDAVSRLSLLHVEAEETALLANLLGRTLFAGLFLAIATGVSLMAAHAELAREISWGLLMLIGSGALLWLYFRTIGSPFERSALRDFGSDLSAVLFYAGFAWGAGAFLILPPESNPVVALLFSACTAVVIAAILRAREPVLIFVVPVALLTALAALLRPFPGAELSASLAVTSCAFVSGAVILSEWLGHRMRGLHRTTDGFPA
jgi:hypothetical protein